MKQYTEDEFYRIFRPRSNPRDGSIYWESGDIEGIPIIQVWTVCDGDGGDYVVNGFAFVNRFAYMVTEVPWVEDCMVGLDHEPDAPL